jgi:NO-binding membrane sensor protein with MHYT domain
MMRVLSCAVAEHNLWIVGIAAIVCLAGSWTTIRLVLRANGTAGMQKAGWHFLAAVGAGSSIWCTHFIFILAYEPGAPVSFDPILTIVSLLVAMASTGLGFIIATSGATRIAPSIGGGLVGVAISAMHYTGMVAFRIDGMVAWDTPYLVASIVLAALFGALSLHAALRRGAARNRYVATAALVLAIVSLHFIGMAALRVTPLLTGGQQPIRRRCRPWRSPSPRWGSLLWAPGSPAISSTTRRAWKPSGACNIWR